MKAGVSMFLKLSDHMHLTEAYLLVYHTWPRGTVCFVAKCEKEAKKYTSGNRVLPENLCLKSDATIWVRSRIESPR